MQRNRTRYRNSGARLHSALRGGRKLADRKLGIYSADGDTNSQCNRRGKSFCAFCRECRRTILILRFIYFSTGLASPPEGSQDVTIRIATPVTHPTISACEG